MRTILIFATISISGLFSCIDENEKKVYVNKSTSDFKTYWIYFRNNIVYFNNDSVKDLIDVPFEIRGYEDIDPIINVYDKDSAINFLNKFLDVENTTYKNIKTHREFIRELSHIEIYDTSLTNNITEERIENMEFDKTKNGWKLSRIYMDTKAMR